MKHIQIPRFVLLCGLGFKQPENGIWCAKSGLRLTGIGDHGAPFGRARAVLLYLARKGAGSGRVIRGTLDEIRTMFGVQGDWRVDNLDRHFQRVVDCAYQHIDDGRRGRRRVRTLDVIRRVDYRLDSKTFEIELGDELMPDNRDSFECPLHLIRALVQAGQFQALDLLLWYHWKLSRKDRSRADPFGPDGPFGLAAIAELPSKQRERLDTAHAEVVAVWPDCPFRVVGRGCRTAIVYAPNRPHGRVSTATRRANQSASEKRIARIRLGPSKISPMLTRMRKRLEELEQAVARAWDPGKPKDPGGRGPPR